MFDFGAQAHSRPLLRSLGFLGFAGFLCAVPAAAPVGAQELDADLWVTDGAVKAIAVSGSTAYVGGSFSRMFPVVGAAAVLGSGTGLAAAPYGGVVGTVYAAASDGAGGWYIGGMFSEVQGQPRSNLAHLDGAGLLTAWNPGANERVRALSVSPTDVIVGGSFTLVGGQARKGLAAVDRVTGGTSAWDPAALTAQPVESSRETRGASVLDCNLVPCTITAPDTYILPGEVVPICGPVGNYAYQWSNGATTRCITVGLGTYYLNVVDLFTNCVSTENCGVSIVPDPGSPVAVYALQLSGGSVYVGGEFTRMGGQDRANLALVDLATGAAAAWNPGTNNNVNAITLRGTTLYVGGNFTTIGGQPRHFLAAVDAANGVVAAFNPNPDGSVTSLRTTQRTIVPGTVTVFAAGYFTQLGGQPRFSIGAVNGETGVATAFNPAPDSEVLTLSLRVSNTSGDATTVYVGGRFANIGGQSRKRIAALASTGLATAWDPGADDVVEVVQYSPTTGTVFAGGSFDAIGGVPRRNLAAVDLTTGAPTAWNPGPDGEVRALAMHGANVFVGGAFSNVGGQARPSLAELDGTTGQALAFNPFPLASNGFPEVNAITERDGVLYVGGIFLAIGSQLRNNLAALEPATGLATSWNPNSDAVVHALATTQRLTFPYEVRVFAGGDFCVIGGQVRCNLAMLDGATGLATAFDAGADYDVRSILIRRNTLTGAAATIYVGGDFLNVGGQPRKYIAALAPSGTATDWNPQASSPVNALAFRSAAIVAGGSFSTIGGAYRLSLAELDATTGLATDWNPGPGGTVMALQWTGDAMYVGGSFVTMLGRPRANFARLPEGLVGVGDPDPGIAPAGMLALAAAPNPFRGGTGGDVAISCTLPAASARVDVTIHDLAGRLVRRLHGGALSAGTTRFAWDGRDDSGDRVATGVYFIRARDRDRSGVAKLVRI